MTSDDLCLGAILVITLVLIAFFVWRRIRRRRAMENFSYSTPALPRTREAAGALFLSLERLVGLGRDFETAAAQLADATPYAAARQSAAMMTESLGRTQKALSGSPPTYANYLAIYRGLVSTDVALLDAADAYTAAGQQIHQTIARAAGSGESAALGATLVAMGACLRRVVQDVHRLGASLDVE